MTVSGDQKATQLPSADLTAGAHNLLIHCADLKPDDSLLIICEDPKFGWYDKEVSEAIAEYARTWGIEPTLMQVGGPENDRDPGITQAMADNDVTVFLARIGDQDRFEVTAPGKKVVMSYARDAAALASSYGRSHHHAFLQLKAAVNEILLSAKTIRVTCPKGTDISGSISQTGSEGLGDVGVRRFPMGVPQPLDASDMTGNIVLANYLTPTGSRAYDPASLALETPVVAQITSGRLTELRGDQTVIDNIRSHNQMVADKFDIDPDVVHSFHAGIHPGCSDTRDVASNPDRWSNTVFTNPRVLHFHTCGTYAPGEICWMLIDHTLAVDGVNLWENGQLKPDVFAATRICLEDWPELIDLFAAPSRNIGLNI